MARQRSLPRAPITEALFDFRVSLPPDFELSKFGAAHSQIRDRYPVMEEVRRFEAIFEVKTGKPSAQLDASALLGYHFKSADTRDICQFRRDGFTLNRLAQYTSWEQMAPEALRLWGVYSRIAAPERVDRLALRYINRLTLPAHGNLEDFLEVTPPTFPGAPEAMQSFLVKQTRQNPANGYTANIVESLEPNLSGDNARLTLDIDVYKMGGLGLSERELTPVLADLRRLKNDIFFGVLTDRTLEQYE